MLRGGQVEVGECCVLARSVGGNSADSSAAAVAASPLFSVPLQRAARLCSCRRDPCHPALPRSCTRVRGGVRCVWAGGDSGAVACGQRTAGDSTAPADRGSPRTVVPPVDPCVHTDSRTRSPPTSRLVHLQRTGVTVTFARSIRLRLGRRRPRPAVRRLVARVHFLRSLFGASLLPHLHRRHAGRQSVRAVVSGAAQG